MIISNRSVDLQVKFKKEKARRASNGTTVNRTMLIIFCTTKRG
jgi:hypothetical protein